MLSDCHQTPSRGERHCASASHPILPRGGKRSMTFKQVFALHPRPTNIDHEVLLRCIQECLDCSASCTACADASLSESDSRELTAVVRLASDCADTCDST